MARYRCSSGSGGSDFEKNNAVHKYIGTPPSDGVITLGFEPKMIMWSFTTSGSLRTYCYDGYNTSNYYTRIDNNAVASRNIGANLTGGIVTNGITSTGFTIQGPEYIENLDVYAVK